MKSSTWMYVLIPVAIILIVALCTVVFMMRRRVPEEDRELSKLYDHYNGGSDPHFFSLEEWERMAEAGLKASRRRRSGSLHKGTG